LAASETSGSYGERQASRSLSRQRPFRESPILSVNTLFKAAGKNPLNFEFGTGSYSFLFRKATAHTLSRMHRDKAKIALPAGAPIVKPIVKPSVERRPNQKVSENGAHPYRRARTSQNNGGVEVRLAQAHRAHTENRSCEPPRPPAEILRPRQDWMTTASSLA
jgi:hypothetical protein